MITIPKVEHIVLLDTHGWRLEANATGLKRLLPGAQQLSVLYENIGGVIPIDTNLVSGIGDYLLCGKYNVFEQKRHTSMFDELAKVNAPKHTILCSCFPTLEKSIEQRVRETGCDFDSLSGAEVITEPYISDIRSLQVSAHLQRIYTNIRVA